MERIEAYSMGIQLEQEQMIQLEKKRSYKKVENEQNWK